MQVSRVLLISTYYHILVCIHSNHRAEILKQKYCGAGRIEKNISVKYLLQ